MLNRGAIKENAKAALKANYGTMVGMMAAFIGIEIACSLLNMIFIGYIANLIVLPIILIGMNGVCIAIYRGQKATVGDMFNGFKNFGHNLGGYWWKSLFLFLWCLCFYIPGIIKFYSYFLTEYILIDHPEIDAQEALNKSKEIMNGHKWELFVAQLTFIGWVLLSECTLGILFILWVGPYMMLTFAGYYVELTRFLGQGQCGAAAPAPGFGGPQMGQPMNYGQPMGQPMNYGQPMGQAPVQPTGEPKGFDPMTGQPIY